MIFLDSWRTSIFCTFQVGFSHVIKIQRCTFLLYYLCRWNSILRGLANSGAGHADGETVAYAIQNPDPLPGCWLAKLKTKSCLD